MTEDDILEEPPGSSDRIMDGDIDDLLELMARPGWVDANALPTPDAASDATELPDAVHLDQFALSLWLQVNDGEPARTSDSSELLRDVASDGRADHEQRRAAEIALAMLEGEVTS